MKKLVAILLSSLAILSLVACNISGLTDGELIEHDASKVEGNVDAISQTDGIMLELSVSFEGTGEVNEATAEKIVYAKKGGLFYISSMGEEALIDTRDAEKAYLYSRVEGEGWTRETLVYGVTGYTPEKVEALCDQYTSTLFGYLTMYSEHASIPMVKTATTVAGRQCDSYSFSIGILDYSIAYSLSIDVETGVCLEWKFSGQAGEAGSASVAFECTSFETPYEVEVPTEYTDVLPEIPGQEPIIPEEPEITE